MKRLIAAFALLALASTAATANDLSPEQQEQVKLKSIKWMEQRQKADALVKKAAYGDAEKIFQQIIAERKALGLDLLPEYDGLGSLYVKWQKPSQAMKTYKDMVADREKLDGPDSPDVIYALKQYAACLTKFGKKDEAKAALARASTIERNEQVIPKFPKITAAPGSEARIAEADKMRVMGEKFMVSSENTSKALAYFQRAIELNPNDALAVCRRGEAEMWFENYSKAEADFNKAIKLKPDLQRVYVQLALLHESRNNNKAAVSDFDKAIALNPKDTDSMGDRAKLLDSLGKHQDAIAGFTKAIEANPSLYWPYIQRSTVYTKTHEYKLAIADLTTLVNRAPEDPDFYEYRAAVYSKAGDLDNALSDYNQLIKLNPKYSVGYHERAKLYEKLDGQKTSRVLSDYAMAKRLGYSTN